jgi:hypothetical protein
MVLPSPDLPGVAESAVQRLSGSSAPPDDLHDPAVRSELGSAGERSRHLLALMLVMAASLAYVWLLLDRGWVPHDEGVLGESALRVLRGELPHRDFDEIYTGGLSYLNAFAFELFGQQLLAMRYMIYAIFAAWVPLVYYLASRFVGPLAAAGITLTSVAWSFPNYPAAMPSWYNLFLATASIAALFRFLETQRARWLAVAGLLAGLSILIKIVGLYLVAATLLFLVFMEQSSGQLSETERRPSRWYGALVTLACLGLIVVLLLLIRTRLGLQEFTQFVLPGALIAALIITLEKRSHQRRSTERLGYLLRLVRPYALGLLLPLFTFGIMYAAHDALRDLAHGVFITPFRRLSLAAKRPPPLVGILPALVVAGILILARRFSPRGRAVTAGILAVALVPLLKTGETPGIGVLGWLSISQAIPVTVLVGTIGVLQNFSGPDGRSRETQRLVLLMAALALCNLVQFPWTSPTYFAFVAPLELLTVVAIVRSMRWSVQPVATVFLLFYLTYAITWVTPMMYRHNNDSADLLSRAPIARVLPGRAGLRVRDSVAVEDDSLVPLVRAEARGRYIYATPDSPEVYFLTGFRNPTRTVFDFFDDPNDRTRRILGLLERRAVNLVVLNSKPGHSGPVSADLVEALGARFPRSSVIGRFTIRWRE